MTSFSYPAEKLNLARSCLMLPHTLGEAASIADAFMNCDAAFDHLDDDQLDDDAREWVRQIRELMDYSKLPDLGTGMWEAKAATLGAEEMRKLSGAVDELAHWLNDPERDN